MPKPKLFLLDANIVLEAFEIGIWESLIGKAEITLPSVVVEQEVRYFWQGSNKISVDLQQYVDRGQIRSVAADAIDVANYLAQFDRVFIERIHSGEIEALALLAAGQLIDHRFCTADGPAIQALVLSGMDECGIALEELLQSLGMAKQLKSHFRTQFFRNHVAEGQRMRIQGQGLAPGSRFRIK